MILFLNFIKEHVCYVSLFVINPIIRIKKYFVYRQNVQPPRNYQGGISSDWKYGGILPPQACFRCTFQQNDAEVSFVFYHRQREGGVR